MNQSQMIQQLNHNIEETSEKVTEAYSVYFNAVEKFLKDTMFTDGILNPTFSKDYVTSGLAARREQLEEFLTDLVNNSMEDAFAIGILFFNTVTDLSETTEHNGSTVKADTLKLITEMLRNTENRIKQLVNKLYQDALMVAVSARRASLAELDSELPELTVEEFLEQLYANGFVGIVDKANRRWKPEVYAKMVLRTKEIEAFIAIQQGLALSNQLDLAYIAGKPVDNPCNDWIGVVISLNGKTARFPTYQQVKETLEVFHPNCQHYLIPIKDLSNVPEWVRNKTKQKLGIKV